MKTTIAAVISLDGKITKHDDPDLHSWVSQEDQEHFGELVEASDAIIIGRTTYELMRGNFEHREGLLRLVLTSTPEKYEDDILTGKLEFLRAEPSSVIDYLKQQHKQNVLVAGGEQIMTDFLAAGLVDQLYITIEPKLFGTGISITSDKSLDAELELVDVVRLNSGGTLLLHYNTKH